MSARIIAVLTLVLAVLAIVSPIAWREYSEKKAIELSLLSQISLLEEAPDIEGVSLTYLGEGIENLTKLHFRLSNAGGTDIPKGDIEGTPTISFGENVEILKAKVGDKNPTNLKVHVSFEPGSNRLSLNFGLLNEDDFFEFLVYLSGEPDVEPGLDMRIVGVKEPTYVSRIKQMVSVDEQQRFFVFHVLLLSLLVSSYLISLRLGRLFKSPSGPLLLIGNRLQIVFISTLFLESLGVLIWLATEGFFEGIPQ